MGRDSWDTKNGKNRNGSQKRSEKIETCFCLERGIMADNIEIKYIAISKLKPAEYNPRKASDIEVKNLTESIKKFGLVDPIIVNSAPERKNIIVGGHFRLRVAKQLGYKEVPVVYINIPDIEKEKELNLRLNKNLGSFDYDLLANFDEDLLKEVGFEQEELEDIFQLDDSQGQGKGKQLKSIFEICVECKNEKEQEKIYNKLLQEGYKCRLLTL